MLRMIVIGAALTAPTAALAEDAEDELGWSGEASLSGSATTGNTQTTDVGVALNIAHTGERWEHNAKLLYDFGTSEVETLDADTGEVIDESQERTKDRLFLSYGVDRTITEALFVYGQSSFERDEFSGFETRTFVGVGLGVDILARAKTTWSVRGGPGWRRDEFADEEGDASSAAFSLASDFDHQFNDAVSFANDTTVVAAEETTQISNIAALTATMTDKLSGRVSYEVRHDTDPQPGFESTDTLTRASLVRSF